VRIHLAAEHALQFELAQLRLDGRQLAFDVAGDRLVVVGLGKREQLDGIVDGRGRAVQLLDLGGELGALAAEFLGALGLRPDGRVLELADDFL
jgi:hypothetical protein